MDRSHPLLKIVRDPNDGTFSLRPKPFLVVGVVKMDGRIHGKTLTRTGEQCEGSGGNFVQIGLGSQDGTGVFFNRLRGGFAQR